MDPFLAEMHLKFSQPALSLFQSLRIRRSANFIRFRNVMRLNLKFQSSERLSRVFLWMVFLKLLQTEHFPILEKPQWKLFISSAADVKMEIPVLLWLLMSSILSSTSFQMGKTFQGVVSAAAEQSRRKANMVSKGDGKFGPWGWHLRIPLNQKNTFFFLLFFLYYLCRIRQ